jgi:PPOX class probable F420-dependent enzyme
VSSGLRDRPYSMTTHEPVVELDPRFSVPGAHPMTWPEVRDVIEAAPISRIVTLHADGRPHVTPLLTVWHDGAVHLTTGPTEQKHRNLDRDPRCSLSCGSDAWDAGVDVVVEGSAEAVRDTDRLHELSVAWVVKYGDHWRYGVDETDGVFVNDLGGPATVFAVRPSKVLAFRKGDFAQSRYRF